MPHFHDEGIYDRSWDRFDGEEECDCYWLTGGDENAEVECRYCEFRRKSREEHERRFAANPWYKQCDKVQFYLEHHATLTDEAARASNFAECFVYLMKKRQREFLAANPVLREAVRDKAIEYTEHRSIGTLCAKMLHYIDRQLPFAFGYQLSKRETREFADYVAAETAELEGRA